MDKTVAAHIAIIDKAIKAIHTDRAKLGTLAVELGKSATKANVPAEFLIEGLVKGYMTFIKDSDGLTSVSPACTSALSAAEKSPTAKTIAAAVAALKKQRDAVKADASKASGADKAMVKKFIAGIDDVVGQLEAAAKKVHAVTQ